MRPPHRLTSLSLALLPILGAALAACTLLGCRGHYAERDVQRVRGAIPVASGASTIRIEVPSGAVSVEPSADAEITFECEAQRSADTIADLEKLKALDAGLHTAGVDAGRMKVVAATLPKELDPRHAWVSYRIFVKVPKALRVEVVLGDGHGSVIGMQGGVSLETTHGILLLKRCSGDSRLRTGKGDLTIDAHRGAVDAETGTGKIVAFVDELGPKGVRLVSGNGGIQAHIPRESAFTLDMRAPEGKLDATWQLPVKREHGGVSMSGAVGGGGPPIYIESLAGSVSLRAEGSSK